MADLTRGGQFALIPARVLYDDRLPATAKLLYGEIYRLSYANGYCYASNRDFVKILLCSDATVTRLIGALKDCGHIRVSYQRRHGATGDIVQRRIFCGQELAAEDPQELPGGTLKNEDTSPQNLGDRPLKNEGTLNNVNNKKKKEERGKENPPAYVVPPFLYQRVDAYCKGDCDMVAAIIGLLENRAIACKKPVGTLRSLNGILSKLDRLSGGIRARKLLMLENATTANWLTVFPLKPDELLACQEQQKEASDAVW